MTLKLDMSQAYDRVELSFLDGVLCILGFEHKWIKLIMKCISSVSYSILINVEPHGRILPICGTHQGDPLSPYLSILCAKALRGLLQRAERNKEIMGVPIAKGRVRINYLFFVNNNLLFCQANNLK